MSSPQPVRESILDLDAQSWLIGGNLLLTRHSNSSREHRWTDQNGSYFSVAEAKAPIEKPHEVLSVSGSFPKVYDAGDAHVVWKIGNAFLKIIILDCEDVTREHVTLAAVKEMRPSFMLPEVLYHGEWEGRYYLVTTEVPGLTLERAWKHMDDDTRDRYARKMVRIICKELATYTADYLGGIDGRQLGECYLRRSPTDTNFDSERLLYACQELGMDCSKFLFYHCDLGPTNVLVDIEADRIGIIDWEIAGYVPKEWIKTKIRVSPAMDFEYIDFSDPSRQEWRVRIHRLLEIEGFTDVADRYMAWLNNP